MVYRFKAGEAINLGNAKAIVDITNATAYTAANAPRGRYTYVVTVLDRCNNESAQGACVTVK